MQISSQQYVYHGASAIVPHITPMQFGTDGELLCTSLSVNVALRYGPIITRLTLNDCLTATMTVKEWTSDSVSLETLRKAGYCAVHVTGEPGCFDFPVDMVVVLDVEAVTVDKALTAEEILELADAFSDKHEPDGPAAIGWDDWLADLGGPLEEALENLGWVVTSSGAFQVSVPSDELWREYSVLVYRSGAAGYAIESDWGSDAMADTLAKALRIADQWRRDELERRCRYAPDTETAHHLDPGDVFGVAQSV